MGEMDSACASEIELSAKLENIRQFRERLESFWEANNLPHGKLNGLLLVVTELCNNACEYSEPAPSRFYLNCSIHDDTIRVCIKDNGQSFNPHDGVNPNFWNEPDMGDNPSSLGAGCYLILHYFPDLEYLPAGQSASGLNETLIEIPLEYPVEPAAA